MGGGGWWEMGLRLAVRLGAWSRGRSLILNRSRMFLLFSCYLHEIAPEVIQLAVTEGVKVQIVSLCGSPNVSVCVCAGHDYKA